MLTLSTYDDWNLIEERDANGELKASYVHGPRIDEIVVMHNTHGTFYPQHDALGNVTLLTDSEGHLAERYSYSVTGEVTIYDASSAELPASALGNRWMFTGREWLPELGLYDYRNRIYSPQLGRFLQTDPVKFYSGDINLYRYVANNFVNLSDSQGEAAYGFRINATASFFLGLNLSIAVVWDDKGGFDVMVGMGAAAVIQTPIPAGSVTGGWTITNAESVNDLRGFGFSSGVAVGAEPAVEKNWVFAKN